MATVGVREYYANKTIFITGGTGFIGKILLEKLLRCCPEIKAIYLLMRKKHGQNSRERLDDLLKSRCFEKVKDLNVFSKLRVIPGDITEKGLGISDQNRNRLQKEVQIVFHSAASIRFDMGLRDAMTSNVMSTKYVLELAEGIDNLEVFVDISTSYCQDDMDVVEEKVYSAKHRPQDVINCVRWMSDDALAKIQPELIKPYVNTYGYSKHLSEDLVSQFKGKFSIAIARPSIVSAAYKEPIPGWVDNINGLTGFVYAGASGVLHTAHWKDSVELDLIPVDVVANGVILLAYFSGIERTNNVRVCNITNSGIFKATFKKFIDVCRVLTLEYPLSRCLYYPGAGSVKKYRFQHKIAQFVYHIMFSYCVDFLLLLFRQKTFMIMLTKKLHKRYELIEYYTSKTFVFKNDYFLSMKNRITQEENEIFYTDLSKIEFFDYMKKYMLGVREFIAKEDLSTLPQAKRHSRRLYYFHVTLKTLFYILLAYITYCLFVKFLYY